MDPIDGITTIANLRDVGKTVNLFLNNRYDPNSQIR